MDEKDLDKRLLKLSACDWWTIRFAFMHMLILGTTGSGKSSATMKQVVLSMLYAGFGCLFCIAKPEDAIAIKKLIQQAGREANLIEITENRGRFNFLAWQLARTGSINAVVDLLMHVIDIVRNTGPSAGRLGDEFWTAGMLAMLRATIGVIYCATGTVSIDDVLAFIGSAPTSLDEMKDANWQQRSAFYRSFRQASERLEAGPVAGFTDADAQRAIRYWQELTLIDTKTSGGIKITLKTALSRFEHGILRDMFCGETDVVPELVFHNGILLPNIPVQIFQDDGAIAQKIWKYCVQQVCLARNGLDRQQAETPVAIIADEAQNFLHQDAEFLAQCRSSRVAVVFAIQSIPTIRAKIGGDNAHDRAEHQVSNFNTVVLHSSACPVTNEWFSKKIGKSITYRGNYSQGYGTNANYGMSMNEGRTWGTSSQRGGSSSSGTGGSTSGSSWSHGTSSGGSDGYGRSRGTGTSQNVSQGYSEQLEFTYDPGEFGRILRTGGPMNKGRVDAVFFQAGRCFAASGSNALLVSYRQ